MVLSLVDRSAATIRTPVPITPALLLHSGNSETQGKAAPAGSPSLAARILFACSRLTNPLTDVVVGCSQPAVGHRELWVQLYRPLEEWKRVVYPLREPGLQAQAVSLQSLERRCGRLLHRCVIFLNRGQRFAEVFAHSLG